MHKQETSKNESELQCSIREWRRIGVSSSQILFPGDSDGKESACKSQETQV